MGGLRDFIETLHKSNELVKISTYVNPELEIAEITDRVSKSPNGGKALLFENNGTEFPVLINMYGSQSRICSALRVDSLDKLAERIYKIWEIVTAPKSSFSDKLRMVPLAAEASKWLPKYSTRKGECQQVIWKNEDADLSRLPILKCWPNDGGRFITLPMVTTKDPESGSRNIGMYRMQIMGKHSAALHWHPHKTGAKHYNAWKKHGGKMPVAVCLGGDPAYAYSATAPLPDGIDEWILSGFIRNKPVELVKCLTNELHVPSDCDFVIEGFVDISAPKVLEGPFGDHTGFYSLEDYFPQMEVTCITHRHNAVYPATLVGIPPQEDALLGLATERIFLAPIRLLMQPEISDMKMPPEGGMHNLALVTISNTFPQQGFKVASGLWGAGQMMFNKALIILPDGIDLCDNELIAKYISRTKRKNILLSQGPLDILDHAAQELGSGGKIALDLTSVDIYSDIEPIGLPTEFTLTKGIERIDTTFASKWSTLVINADRTLTNIEQLKNSIEQIWLSNGISGIKFTLVVDSDIDQITAKDLVWWALANFDADRDLTFTINDVLIIDARRKTNGLNGTLRRWPNPTTTDRNTIDRIDQIWDKLNLGELIKSPSEYYQKFTLGTGSDSE